MKRFLFLLILVLTVSFTCMAQKMTVETFEPLPNDLTASTEKRLDANNEACALVKVQLAQAGATFHGNVVGEVSYSQSEYRVYMTDGSKRLQVRLDGCQPLDIDFAQHNVGPLKLLSTYKLVLALPETFYHVANETRTSSSSSISSMSAQSYMICPDDHHPHMIDLGLPSGTKWSCCNVGASKPEEYGGYYAWGETEVQANNQYDWSSYKHCDGASYKCHDIGKDISGTQYDVAHVKMGGTWRMPTYAQIKELLDNCKWTWTARGWKRGIEVTGPNGNKVFLPAAGYRMVGVLDLKGSYGDYWSSSLDVSFKYLTNSACTLNFNSVNWDRSDHSRACGCPVRAVCP